MFATFHTPDGGSFAILRTSITSYCETRDPAVRNVGFLAGESTMLAPVAETIDEIAKLIDISGFVRVRTQLRDNDGQPILAWAEQAIDVETVVGYGLHPNQDHCLLLVQQGRTVVQLLVRSTLPELEKAIQDALAEV